ncbi:transcriptional regulator, GntR family [Gordonia polyisoprenivorans VH2]|uniref:Transcriptional regulator, GntR family n=1 Tax=Gordonia polyisoprenivorans (strain DSM 44266 / VH2) TaxID=1112204 RepID=H6N3T1_GORPV|nr:GntR family transcriptional regulator [Gordonia polyisoprenivorans]AFA73552.1 transcriptional regulator, GntR family [Gordonia polyisoprenivorans VH2]
MPKRYGIKDRDVAAAWVIERVFDGTLRSGDRLDRQEIADAVGISRVPVQEMLAQLERDGIVRTEYHRGAYLERFDPEVIRETYDLFGMVSGRASESAARVMTRELSDELDDIVARMRDSDDDELNDLSWEFRRLVNTAASGPRMRAMLSTFRTFMPTAFVLLLDRKRNRARILQHYRTECAALARRDAAGARRAAEVRSAEEGEMLITELVRRGVFESDGRSELA